MYLPAMPLPTQLPPPRARVARALLLRCPACGAGGILRRWLPLQPRCATCRFKLDRGDLMRTPMLALPLVVALLLGCEPATGTRAQENWEARLSGTSTLLFMRFSRQGETLSGTAEFAELTGTTPERFALSGTRSADTVSIVLSNPVSIPVRLSGWYVRDGAGLSGLLDGGAFNQLPVEFRR